MADKNSKNSNAITLFGAGAFLLLVLWGLWHGVIGPRLIEPTFYPIDPKTGERIERPAPADSDAG